MTFFDPRTPVVVGVGQFSEKVHAPGYQALSPIEMSVAAVRLALVDAGVEERRVVSEIDTAVGIRSYADSMPTEQPRLQNYPRAVCDRIGAEPATAVWGTVGGHTPQRMLTEVAGTIAAGRSEVAILFGAEAVATARHLGKSAGSFAATEERSGQLDDRGLGLETLPVMLLWESGLTEPTSQFAIYENARRARLGLSQEEYARQMGELFAPLSAVAATNPHAFDQTPRTPMELSTPSAANRFIAEPYPRALVAQDRVNQSAAVVVMSAGAALRLGVDPERWVYLHGHGDLDTPRIYDRHDLSRSPASVQAVEVALAMAGLTTDQLDHLDLYSCFPVAVFTLTDGLGLDVHDRRGLTVTGGLPFFGGPGNNYAMHAIAETCQRVRAGPGSFGMVSATGGPACRYSVGIYSTTPVVWKPSADAQRQFGLDIEPGIEVLDRADGPITVETYTVKHTRNGQVGIVAGRLKDGDQRVFAVARDERTLAALTREDPLGQRMNVKAAETGNTLTI